MALFLFVALVTFLVLVNNSEAFEICERWRPILKVSAGAEDQWFSGSGSDHIEKWWSDGSLSTFNTLIDDELYANEIIPGLIESINYKSLIINNWSDYVGECFSQVRVGVYKDGIEDAYIVFDATSSNNNNWFSRNRVLESSWDDIPSGHTCTIGPDSNGCHFSIAGDVTTLAYRNFYINRNYGGCPNDDGWLGISCQERCGGGWSPVELATGRPTIHYSKQSTISNFINDVTDVSPTNHQVGDTFVVSINGCESETKCPTECVNNPCDCDNYWSADYDPNCLTCHSIGCSQCDISAGYFKKDYNYPCVQCQETFGFACMHCQDFHGCAQCISGYTLIRDNTPCGLWYCQYDY